MLQNTATQLSSGTTEHALDLAWQEIGSNYVRPEIRSAARARLARIITANPLCETPVAEVLKRSGLLGMAAADRGLAPRENSR